MLACSLPLGMPTLSNHKRTKPPLRLMLIAPLLLGLAFAGEAKASELEACNGIWLELEAAASCKAVAAEQCSTQCVTTAMERVCASRLTAECRSECVFEADAVCQTSCQETCVPDCVVLEAEQQPPNCMGLCMSDCQQDCNVTCEGGVCRSQCAQICATDCREQCGDNEPEVECEPTCTIACSGSCTGRASVECQVGCQAELFTECETSVSQECTQDCESTGYAIFCDGQFFASAEDLDACAAEIADEFDIHIEFSVEGEASASGWFGCTVDPEQGDGVPWSLIALAGGLFWLGNTRRAARARC
jgi:hypothetical protein